MRSLVGGNYRGLGLTDQILEVVQRVVEKLITMSKIYDGYFFVKIVNPLTPGVH